MEFGGPGLEIRLAFVIPGPGVFAFAMDAARRLDAHSTLRKKAAAVLVGVASFVSSSAALADSSTWLFVGGGGARLSPTDRDATMPALMQLDLGMGTSPVNPFVFGGLFRNSTYFGEGTDLSLLSRGATRGFAQGGYGLALDLGATQRFWGVNTTELAVSLNAGAPWGITLGLNGGISGESQSFGIVLGIDWARLTVHRRSGGSLWPNYPLPLAGDDLARR